MNRYDPLIAPDPEEWLELDEDERAELARKYHRRAGIKLPNENLHAMFHAIVETQVAMGDEIPVCRNLERLCAEGLDRHDAIHAVASVLIHYFDDRLQGGALASDKTIADYYKALQELTAEKWSRSGG